MKAYNWSGLSLVLVVKLGASQTGSEECLFSQFYNVFDESSLTKTLVYGRVSRS